MFQVKTCSARTSHFPLQLSTQCSVSQRTLTIVIRAVALRACAAAEDSIFHTFNNKSCKNLLQQHTNRLPFTLWPLQKFVYQYRYCFLPQTNTHQGRKVCILYFVFVFPLMWLFCLAYVYAKKLSLGTSGQNQFIEMRAYIVHQSLKIDRALKMRFNEGSGSFLRPSIPEL